MFLITEASVTHESVKGSDKATLFAAESVAVAQVSRAALYVAAARRVLENWMARKQGKEESLML